MKQLFDYINEFAQTAAEPEYLESLQFNNINAQESSLDPLAISLMIISLFGAVITAIIWRRFRKKSSPNTANKELEKANKLAELLKPPIEPNNN